VIKTESSIYMRLIIPAGPILSGMCQGLTLSNEGLIKSEGALYAEAEEPLTALVPLCYL
jgi:hypothetical protein